MKQCRRTDLLPEPGPSEADIMNFEHSSSTSLGFESYVLGTQTYCLTQRAKTRVASVRNSIRRAESHRVRSD